MRWLVGLLAVFLVVSHTALPGSATAQDFSSAPPQPAAPTVAQSPESREQGSAQIEFFSPQGTVKGVRQVTARFSTAMVALGDLRLPDPFRIDCPAKGKGRWVDGQNWVYDFETVLESGVRCQFSLQLSLRTLAGQMLSGTRDYRFDTGGPGIRASLPSVSGYDKIKEDQVFILAPDGPVAPASLPEHVYCLVANSLERIGVEFLTGAARTRFLDQQRQSAPSLYDRLFHPRDKGYQPPLEGEALREAEKTLIVLRCRQPLPPASPVSLVWEAGISSPNGLITRQGQRLEFETRRAFTADFQCERIKPHRPCLPNQSMTLDFSESVPTALAQQVRLIGPEGRVYENDSLAETSRINVYSLSFTGPFPANSTLRLEIPANLTDQDQRSLVNADQFPLAITTEDYLPEFPGPFRIIPWRKDGGGVLPLILGHPEGEITGRKLKIQGTESRIGEPARRLAHEDLVILEWLHHVAGSRLGEGFDYIDNRWIKGLALRPVLPGQTEVAAASFTLRAPAAEKPGEPVAIPFHEPGFYVVELASRRLGERLAEPPQTLYMVTTALVTNLAVHLKLDSRDHVNLVWVTRLDDGRPVKGATVGISQSCFNLMKGSWGDSRLIWEGATGEAGTAPVPVSQDWLHSTSWLKEPCYSIVSARSEGDMSFAFPNTPRDFHLITQSSGRIEHTVLDRTLLRAGETVSMKHFIRRQTPLGIEWPADEDPLPKELRIVHFQSKQDYRIPVQIDRQGIGESRWTIPLDAKLGVYEVQLGDGSSETARFQVEEFRLPTMQARVQAPAQPLIRPPAVPLTVFVLHLNGGGAAGLPVTLRTQFELRLPWFPDYADYYFGNTASRGAIPPQWRWKLSGLQNNAEFTQAQSLTLDETGAACATVVIPPRINPILDPTDLNLILEDEAGNNRGIAASLSDLERAPLNLVAEVEYPDANGEWLSVVQRIPLWPAAVQLGLRFPTTSATVGQPLPLRVAALDPQGQPVADQAVTVTLWVWEGKQPLSGGCSGKTDRLGILVCELRFETTGYVGIQAETQDRFGNTSLAEGGIHVSSGRGDDERRLDVTPERPAYEPGEIARIPVRLPFRTATALVTVEREGILDAFVTELSGDAPVVEVPIKSHYAPNVFVTVLAAPHSSEPLLTGGSPVLTADANSNVTRLGIVPVKVNWTPHRLEVRVTTDQENYRPRQNAKVKVTVRRADGGVLPADAEIAFAAVDEALLELQPNDSWKLLEKMMTERGLWIDTATARLGWEPLPFHFHARPDPQTPQSDYDFLVQQLPPPPMREWFDSLLLWRGRVSLNAAGEAELEVPLNDSLTAFRLVAIASAGESRFGTGSTTIRTVQDLAIQSGLPPLVREGDQFRAAFTLRNTSATDQDVLASAEVRLQNDQPAPFVLPPQRLTLPPGAAREVAWPVQAPFAAGRLSWEITARDAVSGAVDRLRAAQPVLPALPVRVWQATLAQVAPSFAVDLRRPVGALPERGGVRVHLQARLGDGLSGVTEYMTAYPYGCLEQRISKTVALRDEALWRSIVHNLPRYLDSAGLLRYFPSEALPGSDVLTAYVLALSHEAGWSLPEAVQEQMIGGLKSFVTGQIARDSVLPTADLTLRKLAAIEALSRYQAAERAMLDSLVIDPHGWPTSALLDWLNILQRLPDLPDREARLAEARDSLHTRLMLHGTTLTFATERRDALGWLMISPDTNAVRALLTAMTLPDWQPDLPRLARGILERQRRGHWDTTTANAWGVLALEQFSRRYEATLVSGHTEAAFGDAKTRVNWGEAAAKPLLDFPWPPTGQGSLQLTHTGAGNPWAIVQSRAVAPLQEPWFAGLRIQRTVTPIAQKRPGAWTRGDVARITLTLEAQSDLSWVVVDDPVPAGASILGSGLGRDSLLLRQGERRQGGAWPIYEERRFEAFRGYYAFVPQGRWTFEYTVRYHTPGRYELPPTRAEALYTPEIFGERPNAPVEVSE